MESIGNKIKQLRLSKNMSQFELAENLGISYSMVGMIEQGRRKPSDEVKIKLCKIFNVSMDYLMNLTTLSNPKQYLEDFLLNCNLTETDYDKIINNIIETQTFNMSFLNTSPKNNFEKAYSKIFNVYMDYLKNNSLETETSISNEKIDDKFIELLKSLDKEKIIANSKSAVVLVYGTIPAGVPIECIEDIIGTEEISSDMLKGNKEYFGLKVRGDSMYPKYENGDILIILKQDDCENGEDCVVMVNGNEGTFKRVFKTEQGIILQPLNSAYSPMVYTNEQIKTLPITILGKVVEIRRKI